MLRLSRWRFTLPALDDDVLWVVAAIFLEVLLLELAAPVDPSAAFHFHWFEFMFVGLATPVLLCLHLLVPVRARYWIKAATWTALIAWTALMALRADRIDALIFSAFTLAFFWKIGEFKDAPPGRVIGCTITTCVAWLVISVLGVPYGQTPGAFFEQLDLGQIVLFGAILILIGVTTLRSPRDVSAGWNAPARRASAFAVIVVIALFAFRQFPFLDWTSVHHMSFWSGPAELVRNGAWLLWDAPSQYGYLNILSIAWMPIASTWNALRFDASLLVLLSGILAFWIQLQRRNDPLGYLAALTTALGVVVLAPSGNDSINLTLPMAGPLRFFWPYVILCILVAHYIEPLPRRRRNWLIAGNVAWLFGTFWSAESAIYVTCAWIPALALDAFIRNVTRGVSRSAAIISATREIGAAAAALVGVTLLIDTTYLIGLHHLPDWYGFVEFGFIYSAGAVLAVVNPVGGAWPLLFCLGLIAATAVSLLRLRVYRAIPLVAGCWGATWAVSSYYIMRSVDSNALAIFPTVFFVIVALLIVADREGLARRAQSLRLATVPLIAWAVALTLTNAAALRSMVLPMSPHYQLSILPAIGAELVPSSPDQLYADPKLLQLRTRVGALSTDRYLVHGVRVTQPVLQRAGGSYFFEPQPFLPVSPSNLFDQLTPARKMQYIARYAERHPSDGWIIADTDWNCQSYLPNAKPLMRATLAPWTIDYCANGREATNVSLPTSLVDANEIATGSLESATSSVLGNSLRTQLRVPVGSSILLRGWLVDTDTTPIHGSIVAIIDLQRRIAVSYGDARADVPVLMNAHHPGTYTPAAGFHVKVSALGLAAGAHRLQFDIASPDGTVIHLEPAIPFTVY